MIRQSSKQYFRGLGVVLGVLFLLPAPSQADLWCTAYYPGWTQSFLPASAVDFRAISHIVHFSLVPVANGSLDSSPNGVTLARSADVVSRAHAAGRKALICVGGADSGGGFRAATTDAHRATLISDLVNFTSARGYDGIDIDWEPLEASDAAQYSQFVSELRTALDGFTPRRLLTAAAASQPALFASLQSRFDQINLMTYDLSGPWPGWVTWFNAPLFDGGYRFPSTAGLVPSADGMVNQFIAAGVVPGKLGIGIAFYGIIWRGGAGTSTGGATGPRQSWTTPPTSAPVPYSTIMSDHYQAQLYHWDTNAQAAFLSLDNSGSVDDRFISYDDEHACQVKISHARNRGLGGVMIWELGGGYRAGQPGGQRDLLLQAVKEGLATPRVTAIVFDGEAVALSFTSLPLARYRVQWTSVLPAGDWQTLTAPVPGTGGILRVADRVPAGRSNRFYRILTPP